MEKNQKIETRDMIMTALMIALVYIAGSVIRVPSVGGFVHIGDCMVFVSVIILGKKKGTLASAIGMLLVDVLSGYYYWAPFTFVIKGVMAYIAGSIIERIDKNNKISGFKKEYIIAFVLSGIFMVIGYFIAGAILSGFLTEKIGLIQGLALASKDIVGNIIQVITGIVIAIPLSGIVLSAKKRVIN